MTEPVIPETCPHGISGFVICPTCQPEEYLPERSGLIKAYREFQAKVAEQTATIAMFQGQINAYRTLLSNQATEIRQQAATIERQGGRILMQAREARQAAATIALLTRLHENNYLPWQEAGGLNECSHGIAGGIACRPCDLTALSKQEQP